MAGRHVKRRTRPRDARLRRRAAIGVSTVGLSTTAGAILAAAIVPVATAPPAKADFGIDDVIMDLFDPGAVAAAADPAAHFRFEHPAGRLWLEWHRGNRYRRPPGR